MSDEKLSEEDKKLVMNYLEEYSKKNTERDIDEILNDLDVKVVSLKNDPDSSDNIIRMVAQIEYLRNLLDSQKNLGEKFYKIIAVLHYFICVDDIMPDSLPDIGYLDDSFIISTVYQEIKNDISQNQNSFAVGLLKSCLEATASNAKMNENDPLIKWFQNQIYVETPLNLFLSEDIVNLKYSLILLSGTPGSGKTQFIKKIIRCLINKYGFERIDDGTTQPSIIELKKGDRVLCVKHDATQVDSEAENAAVKLKDLLAPDWDDTNYERKSKNYHYIIGINKGVLLRLLSFDSFGKLSKGLTSANNQIKLIDLANRSAIFPLNIEDSFIFKICKKICDPQYWENKPANYNGFICQSCYGCELKDSGICPILQNVKAIRQSSVIERIHQIFEINHFRAGQITTFRDVLAILSNMIVGYHSYYDNATEPCSVIRKFAGDHDISDILNLSRLIYYNRAFSSKDIWGEFLEISDGLNDCSHFIGYCGPYFEENSDVGCNMTLFDPIKSASNILRDLDDSVFNEPERYFNKYKAKSKLEERLFEIVLSIHLGTYDPNSENNMSLVNKREFLLYCLVRIARRRYFFEGTESGFKLVIFKYAYEYSDLVKNLKQNSTYSTHSLAGDILRALSGISGGRSQDEGLQISYRSEEGDISANIYSDPEALLELGKLPNQKYIEDYPRFLLFKLYDDNSGNGESLIELPIDIDTWECLQRSASGYLKKFLGTAYPKSMEGFMESLRSKIWNLPNVKLIISDGKERIQIKRKRSGIQLQ